MEKILGFILLACIIVAHLCVISVFVSLLAAGEFGRLCVLFLIFLLADIIIIKILS